MALLIAPLEALTDRRLSDPERRVLLALYSFRNKNSDTVWPSLPSLAHRSHINDPPRVSKLTGSLAEKGWLTKRKRGFTGTNTYSLTVPDEAIEEYHDTNLAPDTKLAPEDNTNLVPDTKFEFGTRYQAQGTTKEQEQIEHQIKDIAQPKITVEPKTTLTKVKVNPGGTRLPPDWVLSQALGEWALAEGLTRERIRQEADKFRDYWIAKPGAAGRKADWPATWRNWIRKATTGGRGGGDVRSVRGNSLADSLTDTSWAR